MRTFRKIYYPIIFFVLFFITSFATAQTQDEINTFISEAETAINLGNKNQAAFLYNQVALYYWEKETYTKAIEYYEKSIVLNQEIGNSNAVRNLYYNIGMIYSDMHNYDKSLEYFNTYRTQSKAAGRKQDEANALIQIGSVYESKKNYTEAINKTNEALDIAAGLNDIRLMKTCYGMLAQFYNTIGDIAKYTEAFNNFATLQNKVQNEDLQNYQNQVQQEANQQTDVAHAELSEKEKELRRVADSLALISKSRDEIQTQNELLNKEKQLQELAFTEQETKLKHQKIQRNFFIAGAAFILAILLIVAYSLKEKKAAHKKLEQQNQEIQIRNMEIAFQRDTLEQKSKELESAFQKIEKQNHDITNSITYAQRIQKAMLTGEENLHTFLPDSFILLKPRDMVSGDFYWFAEVERLGRISEYLENEKEGGDENNAHKGFSLAAIDCTGHGVPGAFMSMIGFNLLNEIASLGIKNPATALRRLHNSVRTALRQDTTDNRDGMDAAFCMIDQKKKIVEFAGAKNPLIYIQDNQLFEIKGDKNPIGGLQREKVRKFTNHKIVIDKPTVCYIFSDGFQDQFGGEHGRKYMKTNFQQFLLQIHNEPFPKQKELLENELIEWKGKNYRQIDDILIIGFRLMP